MEECKLENKTCKDGELPSANKKKFVFAKDKKQAIFAVIVMMVFCLNTVFMVARYLKDKEYQNSRSQFERVDLIDLVLDKSSK